MEPEFQLNPMSRFINFRDWKSIDHNLDYLENLTSGGFWSTARVKSLVRHLKFSKQSSFHQGSFRNFQSSGLVSFSFSPLAVTLITITTKVVIISPVFCDPNFVGTSFRHNFLPAIQFPARNERIASGRKLKTSQWNTESLEGKENVRGNQKSYKCRKVFFCFFLKDKHFNISASKSSFCKLNLTLW